MDTTPSLSITNKTTTRFGREDLMRIFTGPENRKDQVVIKQLISSLANGMHESLNRYLGHNLFGDYEACQKKYTNSFINEFPEMNVGNALEELIADVAPHSVNVSSPYYSGHMTSAIPYFMVILKAIVAALNQNVVKLETSGIVTAIEREVIGKIHRLVFQNSDQFYQEHIQKKRSCLGCFTEDGTLANLQALWIARNGCFPPRNEFFSIGKQGLMTAQKEYNLCKSVVLVSRLSHYSLQKIGDVLGIGNENIIRIDVDRKNRMDIDHLCEIIDSIKASKTTNILAIVATAGTTECGTIDPLHAISEICKKEKIHFHVDAAWGGPTLLSDKYAGLLEGIQLADSVTIDGHKQLYMPMTCGMVFFRQPLVSDAVIYYANYINRPESLDLGVKTISGSREANSLILSSALKILGKKGYGALIDHGIETAGLLADEILKRDCFQLVSAPVLNILNYRYLPSEIARGHEPETMDFGEDTNKLLNEINLVIHREQRKQGQSFVSRTILNLANDPHKEMVVLRSVIMNPMTTIDVLRLILDEQEQIYAANFGEYK